MASHLRNQDDRALSNPGAWYRGPDARWSRRVWIHSPASRGLTLASNEGTATIEGGGSRRPDCGEGVALLFASGHVSWVGDCVVRSAQFGHFRHAKASHRQAPVLNPKGRAHLVSARRQLVWLRAHRAAKVTRSLVVSLGGSDSARGIGLRSVRASRGLLHFASASRSDGLIDRRSSLCAAA